MLNAGNFSGHANSAGVSKSSSNLRSRPGSNTSIDDISSWGMSILFVSSN